MALGTFWDGNLEAHELLWVWTERRVSLHQGQVSLTLARCPGGLFNACSDLFVRDFGWTMWLNMWYFPCKVAYFPLVSPNHHCQWPLVDPVWSNSYWLKRILENHFWISRSLLNFCSGDCGFVHCNLQCHCQMVATEGLSFSLSMSPFPKELVGQSQILFLCLESARCQLVRRRIYCRQI